MEEESYDRPEILRINGVEMRRFKRPKTWAKIPQAKQRREENPNPRINLALKYGPQPRSNVTPTYRFHSPRYFQVAADGTKTEIIPVSNGSEEFSFGGVPVSVPRGSFVEIKGKPIVKVPLEAPDSAALDPSTTTDASATDASTTDA